MDKLTIHASITRRYDITTRLSMHIHDLTLKIKLAKTQLDGLSMRYAQLLQRIAAKSHLRFNTINTVINTDTR